MLQGKDWACESMMVPNKDCKKLCNIPLEKFTSNQFNNPKIPQNMDVFEIILVY